MGPANIEGAPADAPLTMPHGLIATRYEAMPPTLEARKRHQPIAASSQWGSTWR